MLRKKQESKNHFRRFTFWIWILFLILFALRDVLLFESQDNVCCFDSEVTIKNALELLTQCSIFIHIDLLGPNIELINMVNTDVAACVLS